MCLCSHWTERIVYSLDLRRFYPNCETKEKYPTCGSYGLLHFGKKEREGTSISGTASSRLGNCVWIPRVTVALCPGASPRLRVLLQACLQMLSLIRSRSHRLQTKKNTLKFRLRCFRLHTRSLKGEFSFKMHGGDEVLFPCRWRTSAGRAPPIHKLPNTRQL